VICQHTETREVGAARPFVGPVAAAGDENPAAHGGVSWTEECPAPEGTDS
jgi:hypothetical protein